jgi:hypothetical protein
MTATITPNPGKSEMEIATVQIVVDNFHYKGAPEAVTPFIPVFPGAFQLFEVRFDASVIWAEM